MKNLSRTTLRTQLLALGLIPIFFCIITIAIAGWHLRAAYVVRTEADRLTALADQSSELRVHSYGLQREARSLLLGYGDGSVDKVRESVRVLVGALPKLAIANPVGQDVKAMHVVSLDVQSHIETLMRLRVARDGRGHDNAHDELRAASAKLAQAIPVLTTGPLASLSAPLLAGIARMREAEAGFARSQDDSMISAFYGGGAQVDGLIKGLAPANADVRALADALETYKSEFIAWATVLKDFNESTRQFNYSSDQLIQGMDRLAGSLELKAKAAAHEADALSQRARIIGYSIGIIASLLIAVLGFLMGKNIQRAMHNIAAAVAAIKDGTYGKMVVHEERKDEIGDVGRALLVLRDRAIERDEFLRETGRQRRRAGIAPCRTRPPHSGISAGCCSESVGAWQSHGQPVANLQRTLPRFQ